MRSCHTPKIYIATVIINSCDPGIPLIVTLLQGPPFQAVSNITHSHAAFGQLSKGTKSERGLMFHGSAKAVRLSSQMEAGLILANIFL